jgi:hypothetical protein
LPPERGLYEKRPYQINAGNDPREWDGNTKKRIAVLQYFEEMKGNVKS